MALNVSQSATNQTYLSNCTQSHPAAAAAVTLSTFGAVQRRAERPTTLFKLSTPAVASVPTANGGTTNGLSSAAAAGAAAPTSAAAANLSPFDEQEEWAKISEIMATFGTDAIQDSAFATDEERRRAHQATIARRTKLRLSRVGDAGHGAAAASAAAAVGNGAANGGEQQPQTVAEWLDAVGLVHLEPLLRRNGFDDVAFLVSNI